MADIYPCVRKLDNYLDALAACKSLVDQLDNPPSQPEPIDIQAFKVSLRNQVIGGSGDKAAFFGTISTQPTVTSLDLQDMGLKATAANAIITERDALRAKVMAVIG